MFWHANSYGNVNVFDFGGLDQLDYATHAVEQV